MESEQIIAKEEGVLDLPVLVDEMLGALRSSGYQLVKYSVFEEGIQKKCLRQSLEIAYIGKSIPVNVLDELATIVESRAQTLPKEVTRLPGNTCSEKVKAALIRKGV